MQSACRAGEKTSIDGTLRPRPPRLPRGPLYEFNQIDPERLARQRAQGGWRLRTHAFLLGFVAVWALILIPFRGHAHIGPRHFAAAYLPPVQETGSSRSARAAAEAPTPVAPHEIQYLRAPLVLDGVSQARRAGGVPLQARNAAAPVKATPVPKAVATPPVEDAIATGAAATPTPEPSPPPTPAPSDVPQRPNDVVQPADLPQPDRHDPVQNEQHFAAIADLSRPLYYDHVVRAGDTVSTIAERYGVSTATVLWNNPLITNRDALFIGQTLRVPATDGILYNVHLGDTVAEIADEHKVESNAVLSLAQNGLADANAIREGQTILIVGGQPPPPPPPPPPPTPEATAAPPPAPAPTQPPAVAAPVAPPKPAPSAPAPAPATPRTSAGGWIWPTNGPVTSYFGPGHPLGIDIGQGSGGQPILAAKAGTVTFAGGDPCCSYGYYVDISHGGGYLSRYGHCRGWPVVAAGQQVKQGQIICYAGSTGYSTGPHLHFEIRLNGIALNALGFLP